MTREVPKWLFVGQIDTGYINTAQMRLAVIRRACPLAEALCDIKYHRLGGRWGGALFRKLTFGPPISLLNRDVIRLATRVRPNVIWFDKGNWITGATLKQLKNICNPTLVHYTPDPAFFSHCTRHFLNAVSDYDLVVSTKEYERDAYEQAGALRLKILPPTFDSQIHKRIMLTPAERQRFECNVVFIGTYNRERDRPLIALARAGIKLAIWGNGWEACEANELREYIRYEPLSGDDYAKAINAADVGLGLLCKLHPDQSTTRSVEIPACGTMLVAERTVEHLRLFREGHAAEFFSSEDELVKKVRDALSRPSYRQHIADNGRRRVLELKCDVGEQMDSLIAEVHSVFASKRKAA
ncbi:CgeB family protein [Fuerstiella marisgermanici]|uniref:Spore protein YkvP/CgeB glycosyl transferase-like domain-containing protein n=1 Tax=Fuerstiella marisgermanici TaxID=1891926 RepID=A0A1P8WN29_9PLAN|nr:glycosyltransferase [Fuerstiella marisgermanici]APZ95459.1 hypothetical protein Fuma_05117 [Fuerstiella marisgermanici]